MSQSLRVSIAHLIAGSIASQVAPQCPPSMEIGLPQHTRLQLGQAINIMGCGSSFLRNFFYYLFSTD